MSNDDVNYDYEFKLEDEVLPPLEISEFLSLDEILDKINTEGIHSLTEQERQTLETHSNRI
jgi:hypothetical protein